MTVYRFSVFDLLELVREFEFDYADDLDALDAARALSSGGAVEVHDAGRFVARVNLGDEPLNVHDRSRREIDIPAVDADG